MYSKNEGLTVGELAIAIGGLIIIFLIWSNLKNKEDPKVSFPLLSEYHLIDKA